MAKIIGPLLSVSAVGSVGNTMTFRDTGGVQTVRMKNIPPITESAEALIQKDKMRQANVAYGNLSRGEKRTWDTLASREYPGHSGRCMFIGWFLKYKATQ
jgi:hypothetical protein